MSQYGCTLTKKGRELLAQVNAAGQPLVFTQILMGSGVCPDDVFPGDLEGLIAPIAPGTSDVPRCSGSKVFLTLEFRSDLNGGLKQDVLINEFGVFARSLDGGSVLLFYGTLGDNPQKLCAYSGSGTDIRRFPISITVGEEAQVVVDYSPEGLMTAKDVEEYCTTVLLPLLVEAALNAVGGVGGFMEMEESIPAVQRKDNTLYGLIVEEFD